MCVAWPSWLHWGYGRIGGFAANPNFVPDFVFKGSALSGWHKLGGADWRAENGEIIGVGKEGGGWLVMDKSLQDVGIYASFRCSASGACKAGVLLRAEKSAEGTKGIFVSLADGDVGAYDIVLDVEGKEVSRTKLGAGPGPMIRIASGRFSGGEDLVPGFSKPAPTQSRVGRCGGRGCCPTSAWRLAAEVEAEEAAGVRRWQRMNGTRCRSCWTPTSWASRSMDAAPGAPPLRIA